MNPKKSSGLTQKLRRIETTLAKNSYELYVSVITGLLEDYPAEVAARVLSLLQAKDFGTLLRWADSYGSALHATAAETYAASQLVAVIKKYPFPAPELKKFAQDNAVEKFFAAEKRCERYNLKFHRLNVGRWTSDEHIYQRMCSFISRVIGFKPDLERIYASCDFGPGASIGVHGQNTNLARKLLSEDWSCTPSALPYAVSALAQDFHVWDLINPRPERPVCLDYCTFSNSVQQKVRLVQTNKIVFVPKTTLVDRTIAVEPLLNGYVQKGVDFELKRLLKRVGIDLTDQVRNQALARQGSLPGEEDPFVTIDLSSASDSIATEVVRRFLPPDWFDFLNALRAKSYSLGGVERPYHKFTSMGNGFCFPLETLLFASVCAVFSKPKDFIVYGDDIIVRQSVSHDVIKTLWKLGFRHNREKTFLQGPFRESCGADWHGGLDVRPLTLDYALDSAENIIKFHNMSLRKPLWAHAFRNVRQHLLEQIPRSLRFVRPFPGVETSAFEVPFDIFLSSPFTRWNRKIRAWSWMEILRLPTPDKGVMSRERFDIALLSGALRGSSSECPFATRRKTVRTMRRNSHGGATSLWLPGDEGL